MEDTSFKIMLDIMRSVGICLIILLLTFIIITKLINKIDRKLHTIIYQSLNIIKYPLIINITMLIIFSLLSLIINDDIYDKYISYIDIIKKIVIIILISSYSIALIQVIKTQADKKIKHYNVEFNTINLILKYTVYIIALLSILNILKININNIIAFGGIGGIAAGMAAKDLLSNIFGFILIIYDKPFKIGDRICINEKNITGEVQKIGWRVTQLLSYEKMPIYIPNATFTTKVIQNESHMLGRRIKENITIFIEDKNSIENILSLIKDIVLNKKEVNKNLFNQVCITKIGDQTIYIMIYLFLNTKNWDDFLLFKEKIFIELNSTLLKNHAKLFDYEKTMLYKEIVKDTK